MTQAAAYDLAGMAIKTMLAMMFVTWLVEMVAFRNLKPFWRATLTVGVTWLIVGAAAGGWQTRWHGVDWHEAARYAPAAVIVWLFYWRSLAKAWHAEMHAGMED